MLVLDGEENVKLYKYHVVTYHSRVSYSTVPGLYDTVVDMTIQRVR